MRVEVLGATQVLRGDRPVELGTRKQRALVAALVLQGGRPVATDTLVALLWGDEPPASVSGTLHAYVAGLRRALEPDRPPRAASTVLLTTEGGYALCVGADAVDASCFAATVTDAHRRLTAGRRPDDLPGVPDGLGAEDLGALDEQLTAALSTWRGTPYAELGEAPAAVAERTRLEELRLLALEDRALARLALGEHAGLAGDLEQLTGEHPLRERLWALRVTALASAGRQADALGALREVRRTLSDELGIDPGPVLRQLETAVLRQEPVLAPRPTPARRARPRGRDASPTLLVGRDAELAALEALLEPASTGHPQLAVLVGEAGIGKTTLVEAFAARAAAAGFAVVAGRCSEDEGAPPLWPWTSVFSELRGAGLLDETVGEAAVELVLGADDTVARRAPALVGAGAASPTLAGVATTDDAGAAQFRVGDALASLVHAAAAERPLLVVLDDLHWADASSARLLRHVVERPGPARLVVVVTRRRHPEPSGHLVEVAAALGRRHALRLELTGLDAADTARLVAATTGAQPDPQRAEALRSRTDGNPFFLVELLRWSGTEAPLDVPAGVTDVVARRVAALPSETQEILRTAAVIGRSFDLVLLAAAQGGEQEHVLDALEPALLAGVVDDDGADRFRFSHALVRDAVYSGLSPSRRARRHAAVARALDVPAARGRARESHSESAWHWLAAGPSHAPSAWRAAHRAAASASAVHAHEDAAELLAAALRAADDDPALAPVEHYELLMARAQACRCVGDVDAVQEALDKAITEAQQLGDVERVAAAAITSTQGLLWTRRAYGVVDAGTVATLEDALRRLPATDSELRCRVLLVLAEELYYADGTRQRRALVDEGLAMARRLGDPALLTSACLVAGSALWRPAAAAERRALAEEALTTAELAQDETAIVHASAMRAIAAMENGEVDEMLAVVDATLPRAERLRLPFPVLVLEMLLIPWLAMQGREQEAERHRDRVLELIARTNLEPKVGLALGAVLPLVVWLGRAEDLATLAAQVTDEEVLAQTTLRFLHVRGGRLDAARAQYERCGLPLGRDDWHALWQLATVAETALALDLPAEGAAAYARLAPFAGNPASAGSGMALGPVDAFLALAAAAAGDRAAAARHADDALALCEAWRIPLVAAWLQGLRQRHGF